MPSITEGRAMGQAKPEWLKLGDLQPHPEAQRKHFDANRAKKMAAEFDPNALGILTIAETPRGKKWIVDGQHRAAAALLFVNGDKTQQMLCNIVPVANDAEAGALFLKLNNHKAVSTFDKFLVRVLAKEPVAVAITEILARHGLHVSLDKGPGAILSVQGLEVVFNRQSGAAILDQTLAVLRATWGDTQEAYSGKIIEGLGLLLARYRAAIDQEGLVKKLAQSGSPSRLLGQARELSALTRMSVATAVADRMRTEYNRMRKVSRLEEESFAPTVKPDAKPEVEVEATNGNGHAKKPLTRRPPGMTEAFVLKYLSDHGQSTRPEMTDASVDALGPDRSSRYAAIVGVMPALVQQGKVKKLVDGSFALTARGRAVAVA